MKESKAYSIFKNNLEQNHSLSIIYKLYEDLKNLYDFKNMLRAELTLNVSCFDTYFHDIISEMTNNDKLPISLEHATFQCSKSIQKAADYLEIPNIWERLSNEWAKSEEECKLMLDEIIKRRNEIVHESDINKESGEKNDISIDYVKESTDYLRCIVSMIDAWVMYDIK